MDPGLAAEVTTRLGCPLPSNWTEVDDLYQHWLSQVWFDPIAKIAAVRAGREPPGADADAWCREWLATGLGGTCWGQSVAFAAIIAHAGADTWIGMERMADVDGIDFHCHVAAEKDGAPVVYDLIHATSGGLPLRDGAVSTRGPLRVGFELVDGRLEHVVRAEGSPFRYHLLSTRMDRTDVAAFCRVSATHSGLRRDRFFARLLPGDTMVKARRSADGHALEVTTWSGGSGRATTRTFDDLDTGFAALGWNRSTIDALERAGLVRQVDGSTRFV